MADVVTGDEECETEVNEWRLFCVGTSCVGDDPSGTSVGEEVTGGWGSVLLLDTNEASHETGVEFSSGAVAVVLDTALCGVFVLVAFLLDTGNDG